MKNNNYDESQIEVLKGLEPVRLRPGMYTRTINPLHIFQEVVDNAADEALSGYGGKIYVRCHQDGSIEIEDEGRGIPVGPHPKEKLPVVELVFTKLHAGGKFNKVDEDNAYRFAGGLHGVGVSVTNALTTRLEVEVFRDKASHTIVFEGGKVATKLSSKPVARKQTGTRVRGWADPQFFDSPKVPIKELREIIRAKATLLRGVEFVFCVEEKDGSWEETSYLFENGLSEYLLQQFPDGEEADLFFANEKFNDGDNESFARGEGAEYALCFSEDSASVKESYVNLIPTPLGGTHDAGMRDGIFNAVKAFMDANNLNQKGLKVTSDDVCSRMNYVVAAKVLDPQFQGQTKDRLSSREAVKLLSWACKDPFDLWLGEHPEKGKKIAEMALKAAAARQRSSQKIEKKKSSSVATLPGKLTDCETDDFERREVFLVEGDSAGGSAKMGRDKETQAILPLRGKVLNSWETPADRLFANKEIHDIAVAIGIDPHSVGDKVDFNTLRYNRVCILSDADVDGSHIQVLLLTLFYKHFPELVRRGHVYISQPPLFRVDTPQQGKGRPGKKIYCLDEQEKEVVAEKLRLEGFKSEQISVSRFKGLGEMNAEQLWETTLNPDTRKLTQMRTEDFTGDVFQALHKLMGKSEAAARKDLLEARGNEFDADI